MATYKKFCIHCNALVPGDASTCPMCGTTDPFDIRCPKCRNTVVKGWKVCSSCGMGLNIVCPKCGKETFASQTCSKCGTLLLVKCPSKKCGELQIVTNSQKCIKCGKSLK